MNRKKLTTTTKPPLQRRPSKPINNLQKKPIVETLTTKKPIKKRNTAKPVPEITKNSSTIFIVLPVNEIFSTTATVGDSTNQSITAGKNNMIIHYIENTTLSINDRSDMDMSKESEDTRESDESQSQSSESNEDDDDDDPISEVVDENSKEESSEKTANDKAVSVQSRKNPRRSWMMLAV